MARWLHPGPNVTRLMQRFGWNDMLHGTAKEMFSGGVFLLPPHTVYQIQARSDFGENSENHTSLL